MKYNILYIIRILIEKKIKFIKINKNWKWNGHFFTRLIPSGESKEAWPESARYWRGRSHNKHLARDGRSPRLRERRRESEREKGGWACPWRHPPALLSAHSCGFSGAELEIRRAERDAALSGGFKPLFAAVHTRSSLYLLGSALSLDYYHSLFLRAMLMKM